MQILKEELDKQKRTHKYEFLSKEQLGNYSEAYGCSLKNRIPVGTIEFVQTWLLRSCNISTMNPIEIPKLMRTPRILKREYQIVDYDHLPREGIYFLKRVDKLKAFSYDGEVRHLFGVKVTPERGGSFAATYEELYEKFLKSRVLYLFNMPSEEQETLRKRLADIVSNTI